MLARLATRFRGAWACLTGSVQLRCSDTAVSPRFLAGTCMEAEKILTLDDEGPLLDLVLEELRPGDVFLDVGANIGLYAVPAAVKLGSSGRVLAFEPEPRTFRRLQENVALNDLGNVGSYELGLGLRSEECQFVMKPVLGSGMGSMLPDYRSQLRENQRQGMSVRVVNGEEFLSSLSVASPRVVKIDVEGAELDVLRGLAGVLRKPECRFVLCEVHSAVLPEPPERVEEFLRDAGFSLEVRRNPRRREHHVLARRKAPE